MFHRLPSRRDLDSILLHDAVCVVYGRRRDPAIPLNLALPQTSWGILGESLANFVEASLLAAGARVEYEDLHQYGQLQFFTSGKSSPCSCTYCLCSTSLLRRNCLKWAPARCNSGTRSTTSPAG